MTLTQATGGQAAQYRPKSRQAVARLSELFGPTRPASSALPADRRPGGEISLELVSARQAVLEATAGRAKFVRTVGPVVVGKDRRPR